MTVSEYAQIKGISTQAVSNHLKRYKKDLSNHVIMRGRSRVLDEFAVDFLNKKVTGARVTVYDGAKDEKIQQLQDENKQLQQHIITIQSEYVKMQEKLQEQIMKTHVLEMEKLQIESDKQQEISAKERAEAERKQADKNIEQLIQANAKIGQRLQFLQQRKLTFRERISGWLESDE